MSKRHLSIVMPVKNNIILTEQALKSLNTNTHHHYEVILIDDASTDTTENTIRLNYLIDSRIKYIRNDESVGVTKNWNRGIKESENEYIAIVNNDVLFSENWDLPLQIALDNGSSIASPYSINTLNDPECFRDSLIPLPPDIITKWHDNGGFPILGCCFMCKKSLFDNIGYIDERLVLWNNDNWLVSACSNRGFEMAFCPDSHVAHLYSRTISKEQQLVEITNNDARMFDIIKKENNWK